MKIPLRTWRSTPNKSARYTIIAFEYFWAFIPFAQTNDSDDGHLRTLKGVKGRPGGLNMRTLALASEMLTEALGPVDPEAELSLNLNLRVVVHRAPARQWLHSPDRDPRPERVVPEKTGHRSDDGQAPTARKGIVSVT